MKPSSPLKNRIQAIRNKETSGAIIVTWETLHGADEYVVYFIPTGLMDAPATAVRPEIKEPCGGKVVMTVITPDKIKPEVAYSVYIRATREGKYFALLSAVNVNAML